MALSSGYSNNINKICVRANGNKAQIYTDRSVDADGDGSVEQVSVVVTPRGGSKVHNAVTVPAGYQRTVVDETFELDGGVSRSSGEFTFEV